MKNKNNKIKKPEITEENKNKNVKKMKNEINNKNKNKLNNKTIFLHFFEGIKMLYNDFKFPLLIMFFCIFIIFYNTRKLPNNILEKRIKCSTFIEKIPKDVYYKILKECSNLFEINKNIECLKEKLKIPNECF